MKPVTVAAISGAAILAGATIAPAAESIQSVVGTPMLHPMGRPSSCLGVRAGRGDDGGVCRTDLQIKRRPQWWQTTCFFASLAVFAAAVTGPLDRLARNRMFVYIAEQILLYMPGRAASPIWDFRLNVTANIDEDSDRQRRQGSKQSNSRIRRFMVFAGIHFPFVCNVICHARPLFGGIRGALLGAGLLLWWPLLSPLSELTLSRPLQILHLFFPDHSDDCGVRTDHSFGDCYLEVA